MIIILLFAGLSTSWTDKNQQGKDETGNASDGSNLGFTFIIQLLTFWVAYSHMIPISLYVIIEILKLG